MDNIALQTTVAGLLHDLGKVSQRRAGPKLMDSGNLDTFCPKSGGHPHHVHAAYTYESIFYQVPRPPGWTEEQWSRTASIAARHHMPMADNLSDVCVMMADQLASGMERSHSEESRHYKKARLQSIFTQIIPKGADENAETERLDLFYPLKEFSEENLFHQPRRSGDYDALWGSFCDEANTRLSQQSEFTLWSSTLMNLLLRYLWAVPASSYKTTADVSLYDHNRVVAAFSQALFHYFRDRKHIPHPQKWRHDESPHFYMVRGDLSGIQHYLISGIQGRKSTRLFRARSFYLQLLVRSTVVVLCHKLDLLPVANLVDTPDHFTLLLPYTARVRHALRELRESLDREYFQRFNGELSLNIAAIPASVKDFALAPDSRGEGGTKALLERLNRAITKAKQRKFSTLLFRQEVRPFITQDRTLYAQNGVCQLCGKHPAMPAKPDKARDGDAPPILHCHHCAAQVEQLGKRLPKGRNLFLVQAKENASALLPLKVDVQWNKPPHSGLLSAMSLKVSSDTPSSEASHRSDEYELFPVAGYVPEDYTFNDIAYVRDAQGNPTDLGLTALGVLKADVDNLGHLFSKGLPHRTMGRLVFLSRMLNAFFSIVLPSEIERLFPRVYVVYTGGDDLLMLGNWKDMMQLATHIHQRFTAFTGHGEHSPLTLSAGISVTKSNFPLFRSIHHAEELLEHSKKHQNKKGQIVKKAITLFQRTMSWEDYQRQLALAEEIDSQLERYTQRVNTAFLYRVEGYAERFYRTLKGPQAPLRDYLYHAHMTYDLRRNITEPDTPTSLSEEDIRLWNKLQTNHDNTLRNFPVAFHKVVLAQRKPAEYNDNQEV